MLFCPYFGATLCRPKFGGWAFTCRSFFIASGNLEAKTSPRCNYLMSSCLPVPAICPFLLIDFCVCPRAQSNIEDEIGIARRRKGVENVEGPGKWANKCPDAVQAGND